MPTPKLLVNFPSLDTHGILAIWLTKLKIYQQAGFEVYVYSGSYLKLLPPITDVDTFNQLFATEDSLHYNFTTKLSFALYALKRNILSLVNINKILRLQPDLIYTPSSMLDFVIIPAIIRVLRPTIVWTTVFDNIVPLSDPGNKFIRFLAWIFFQLSLVFIRQANYVYAISPLLVKYLTHRHFDSNRIILTGNAIDVESINTTPDVVSTSYDAVFMGRLNETKGIYDLLEVVRQLIPTHPDFRLAIIGRGDAATTSRFQQKIEELNLTQNILFLGYLTGQAKYTAIKSAKMFLFLSKSESESFGIALLEAVACGLPAIVYDLPAYRSIYRQNEVITCHIGDTRQVVSEVLYLLSHSPLKNTKGIKLAQDYTWESVVTKELALLSQKFR